MHRFLIMNNFTNAICGVMIVSLACCSDDDGEHVHYQSDSYQAPNGENVSNDNGSAIKVELVEKFEPYMKVAVDEKWDEKKWLEKMGMPTRLRREKSGVFLEYIDPGPYEASGSKLISGVVIIIRDGATTNVNYHYTSFGMPEYLKK